VQAGINIKALAALFSAVALLTAAPAVAAAGEPYGPADGWVAGKLDYGQPDGWMARAVEGTPSSVTLPVGSALLPYGEPDGWMARALEGPALTLSSDDRAHSRALGPADGWMARALEGVSPDDRAFARALGPADGWMARALTPVAGGVSPDSRNVSFASNPSPVEPSSTPTSTAPGFDWTDAGVGAAGAFLLLGLIGLGVAASRRSHPRGRLAGS
jgi:hypothetical protein